MLTAAKTGSIKSFGDALFVWMRKVEKRAAL